MKFKARYLLYHALIVHYYITGLNGYLSAIC